MIDSRSSRSSGPLAGAPGEVLDAAVIGEWRTSLSAALESPTSLSDGARVESMRGLEELVCVATAAQAHLARELDASQRAEQAKVGVPSRRRGAGVAGQVALARRESPHRGKQHLGLATTVADELPHTWAAWRAGRITEWKVTRIAQETACLDLELRLAVDELVAGDPDALETMGVQEIAAACMKEAARLDAAAVVKRRRKAESERRVTLRPAPDTMTYVTALLPVKDGVAVHAVLNRAAVEARAVGDERTQGQVMADALVGAVTDGGVEALSSTTGVGSAKPRISLGLVMTDAALFGTSDEPGHIDGFGPVPAELAREIVAGACSREEQIWLRRLYTSPDTGELVAMDARGRFFRGALGRFIRLRDRTCRTPWCDAPIRHTDHAGRATDGGTTSGRNGQGLCEACNYAKDALGWRARPGPGGSIETTTPTGHTHTTRPPAVATIRRRGDLPRLGIDYVIAG